MDVFGCGVGLDVVYEMVKVVCGIVCIYNELGYGMCFML